jgi:hypothetical protein
MTGGEPLCIELEDESFLSKGKFLDGCVMGFPIDHVDQASIAFACIDEPFE